MDLELQGKTALVTGSGRGIGLAIAKALQSEGCNIALNARTTETLGAAARSFTKPVSTHLADVSQPAKCQALIEEITRHWQQLDILVCNVGSGASVPPGQETFAEWQRILGLNLLATTNIVAAARTVLRASQGVVLCISSICGQEILGAPLTYSASKAALNQYVRGMARPLAADNVRINAIAPGNIFTTGGVWDRKRQENPTAVQAMLERDVAMQRLGQPEEIADLATFLVSQRASFITGSIYVADGGQVRA